MKMARLEEVEIPTLSVERWRAFLSDERVARLEALGAASSRELGDRIVWCVNSTASGGGVAEMQRPLLAYARGVGVQTRWLVIEGDPAFFRVTKRIHHRIHEAPGDGGPLGPEERAAYEATTARNAAALTSYIRPGDIVLLHDPQTAGLAPSLAELGAHVVWRLHIGSDAPGPLAQEAWDFLAPYLPSAQAYVVSRPEHAWPQMDPDRTRVIPPSIDALAPKNHDLDPDVCAAILATAGILEGDHDADPVFTRTDGTPGVVTRKATLLGGNPLPVDVPVVIQVSRWDPLKDPLGVIEGFARHVDRLGDAHLLYVGPDVTAVTDDPEGHGVLSAAVRRWHDLPDDVRARIHLASLPMEDLDENAAIVNAAQRHAHVVVQKSIAEGFGLTVAEGMWKRRPVVASRVGGMQDQVVDGVTGILLDDTHDQDAFAAALAELLGDPARAHAMGAAGRERVLEHYLEDRHLVQWAAVAGELIA